MDKMNFSDAWRVLLVYLAMLVFGVAIVARIIYIQTVEREELLEQARKVDIKIDTVQGARGNIYSVNGTMLASTVSLYDIGFDFMGVKIDTLERHIGPLTDSLSKLLHRPKAEFEKLLRYGYKYGNEHKYRCVYLAKGLKIDEYQRLKTFPLFRKKSGNGLNITKRMVREHPYGILAMRTVGLVEKSDLQNRSKSSLMKGVVGLEGQYDSCLRGEIGYQLMRRVSGGNRIQVPSSINKEPKNGCDIYTSIDVELQDVAEEALMRCLKENEAEKGCVIMMDVETGFVEVMANLEYNYNTKQYEERWNVALGQSMEPGSTFKAITMTALMENDPNFNIKRVIDLGPTGTWVYEWRSKNGRAHHFHVRDSHVVKGGKPTVEEAFWESSNIAFSKLVVEYFEKDPKKFIDFIYKTKINEPLRVAWKGEESNPKIKSPESKMWSYTSLPSMAMGYELTVTPMVILTYYNAIANNGRMMKPQFVKEIRRGDEVVQTFEPIVINERIASERTIKTLQGLLRGVVENGTAKALNKCPFPIAGKTGTAQISSQGGYNKKNYTASFVGYFPADEPKYSCAVIIINPMGGKYYGASVSAPVLKDVAEKVYATRLGIEDVTKTSRANADKYTKASMAYYNDVTDYCEMTGVRMVDGELGSEWVKVSQSTNGGVTIENMDLDGETVPDLKGMNVMDAVYLIEKMGWKAGFSGKGVVESQSVKAGTKLEKGKVIVLKLAV